MADVEGFVAGDTVKALRAIITDTDGERVDITNAECRLFAVGRDNGDKPTSDLNEGTWGGITGALVNLGATGEVDFAGFGGKCQLDELAAQDYEFMVKIIYPAAGGVSWTYPVKTVRVVAPVGGAV